MSTLIMQVHESKLAYALINKCLDLHREVDALKVYGLGNFFPNIGSQWNQVLDLLRLGVSSKIAWTGQSMTKGDTVPDDTRIPPNVEINEGMIRVLHAMAKSNGITLAEEHLFFDESDGFVQAMGTWTAAAKLYLDILVIAQEFTMYRYMLSEYYLSSESLARSPGQLVPFMGCAIPLASGDKFPPALNWDGIVAACGDYYKTIMVTPALEVFATPPGGRNTETLKVDVMAMADPDSLETRTVYPYTSSKPIIGVVTAVDTDGTYHVANIVFDGDMALALTLEKPIGEAPALVTFTVHTMEPL
ncbi:MAG: hypothetical protein JEZ12_26200 [Desulfobacterium sp.]|nr:hypothetical protein [Desulfobacterium sp.]